MRKGLSEKIAVAATLSMTVMLVLAPAVLAQAPVPGSAECPETRVTPDGIQCSNLPDAIPAAQYTENPNNEQYHPSDEMICESQGGVLNETGDCVPAPVENPLPYTPQREAAGECRAQGLLADETGACIAPATETAPNALPATGGISLLLPAAVLLLGSGILGLAIARRNS